MSIKISIVIPIEPDIENPNSYHILNRWKNKGIETIIVKGKNPSLQRNRGIEKASGDIIYFLDKDSEVNWKNIEIIKEEFENNNIDILGGPQILPETGPTIEEIYYDILSTPVLTGKTASRYTKKGTRRDSNDSELILCNLAMRKSIFSEIGYFNEELYPNEENDLLAKAKKKGKKIIYNPDFYVEKPMKLSIIGFIKQTFKYGFGRGNQTRKSITSLNILKFLFILFAPMFILGFFVTPFNYILFTYLLFDILIAMILSNWSFFTFFHYLILIPLFHFSYSVGILFGLFLKNNYIKSQDIEIIVL